MKAKITIPEKGEELEVDNITYEAYKFTTPYINKLGIMSRETFGNPVILITSNMPKPLKDAIDEMVQSYIK